MKEFRTSLTILSSIFLSFSNSAQAHKGVDHGKPAPVVAKIIPPDINAEINAAYKPGIKKVLLRACGDCHSDQTRYPWYSSLPFVGQWIEADIKEAKEHLDISGDFPFKGHGSPKEDLEAIKEVLVDDSMPPKSYGYMHWSDRLTDDEKDKIHKWLNSSLEKLR